MKTIVNPLPHYKTRSKNNEMNSQNFKRLLSLLGHFRKNMAIVIFFGILSGICEGQLPALTEGIGRAWNDKDANTAYLFAILIPGVWILNKIFEYVFRYQMKFTGDLIAARQRMDLMKKYLSLDLQYLSRLEKGSGGLISRMINDISIFQEGMHNIASLGKDPVKLSLAVYYIVNTNWMLGVLVLIAMPIIALILKNLARSLRKYGRRNQESLEDLTKTMKESLDGARVIQSFNLENHIERRFTDQTNQMLQHKRKVIQREEASGPISEILAVIAIGGLLAYMTWLVGLDQFSTLQFTATSAAAAVVGDALRRMRETYIKLQQALVALDRINEILDTKSVLHHDKKPAPFPNAWNTIEYKNVSFKFDDQLVLRNINLKIRRGEVVAFVGSSGSGKSTLVNLLPRFADPTEGEILIDGISLKNLDMAQLRDQVALVTQDVFLFGDTIENNIWLANQKRDRADIKQIAKLANAHDFIMQTEKGYDTRLGDHGARLSGGEKQRISIARALFKDAPILVLDEATSALDSISELEVKKGLDHLLEGRTALIIAHRLSTVTTSDRIIVMQKGQIVEEGSHEMLLKNNSHYANFYMMQTKVDLVPITLS